MKNFRSLHILFFIFVTMIFHDADAQDYIVTARGDTLKGEIKLLLYGPEKKVQVTTPDHEKKVISIFQTRFFNYQGDIYHPVKGSQGYVFMKLIKGGYLSLYAFQLPNQVNYDGLYLRKKDGTGMEVPNLAFKKLTSRFLDDCPEVSAKIESGDLNKKSIEDVVDAYNNCIKVHTVDRAQEVAQQQAHKEKINAWDVLEEKVKARPEFEEKTNALEMITDIKKKISRNEKIPNFLLEGLKHSLPQPGLREALRDALKETE